MTRRFVLAALWLFVPAASRAQDQPDPRWLRRSQQSRISPLRRRAYLELARLHLERGDDGRQEHYRPSPSQTAFASMGLDVLPVLAEALDDNTPTQRFHVDKYGKRITRIPVNEWVARLIVGLAQRNFVLGDQPHERLIHEVGTFPELTPRFQRLVLDWYAHNRNRTLTQRKIMDLSDGWFRNRLDALEWLGRRKEASGTAAIIRYIDRNLAKESVDTLTDTELAESALALGQIGDRSALPAVRRVRDHLLKYAEGPNGLPAYFQDYIAPAKLFQVYQSLALLGEKSRALKDLQRLYARHAAAMQPKARRDYQRKLKAAALW